MPCLGFECSTDKYSSQMTRRVMYFCEVPPRLSWIPIFMLEVDTSNMLPKNVLVCHFPVGSSQKSKISSVQLKFKVGFDGSGQSVLWWTTEVDVLWHGSWVTAMLLSLAFISPLLYKKMAQATRAALSHYPEGWSVLLVKLRFSQRCAKLTGMNSCRVNNPALSLVCNGCVDWKQLLCLFTSR